MRVHHPFLFGFVAVGLLGCSTHPLPDRVVGLNTAQIVNKLRCEAVDAVADLLDNQGLASRLTQFYASEAKLRWLEKQRDNGLVKLQPRKQRLEKERTDLFEEDEKLTVENRKLRAKIKKDAAGTGSQRAALEAELKQLTIDSANYELDLINYENKISTYKKDIENVGRKLIAAKNIHDANLKDIISFRRHNLAYAFNFVITETNNLNSSGSFAFPTHVGSITIGYEAGDEKERSTDRTVKLAVSFADLLDVDKENKNCASTSWSIGLPGHYPIKGDIGLYEIIDQYYSVFKTGRLVESKSKDSFSETLMFTTTLTAGTTPSITITPWKGNTYAQTHS